MCVIDDAQWLDRASAQVLAFVARRLLAEPVVLLFAAREPSGRVRGPARAAGRGARAMPTRAMLLASVIPGPAGRARRRAARRRGARQPAGAARAAARAVAAQLAGGFGLPGALSLAGRIEQSFRRAAGGPAGGHPAAVAGRGGRAARRSGAVVACGRAARDHGAAREPAESAGLIEIDGRVRFRHPLVRSAIYRRGIAGAAAAGAPGAGRGDRRRRPIPTAAPGTSPRRRAGPDEDVAAELERAAGRAQARGGLAAAAAFLERAAALDAGPCPACAAGPGGGAGEVRGRARSTTPSRCSPPPTPAASTELQRARVHLLRAQIAFAVAGAAATLPRCCWRPPARSRRSTRTGRATTYLEALEAARFAGPLARGTDLVEVSEAALAGPAARRPPRPTDLLLAGAGDAAPSTVTPRPRRSSRPR